MVHLRAAASVIVLLALSGVAIPTIAEPQESEPKRTEVHFDTEHIFGFAEGSDIGAKGEVEIESTTIGSFGALGSAVHRAAWD
jgi:hypothetical protein